jgi:tRNA(Ile2)-agmatinylcytidine synthase
MLEEFSDLDLIGLPRLVRLNPNIPWKTRGNAAISLCLGRGSGKSRLCGQVADSDIRCFNRGAPVDPAEMLERASKVLKRVARFDCDKTNPGIVASVTKPPPALYWGAVRGVLGLRDVESQLMRSGARWRKFKNGRGVIGAASAMSWRPRDRTWEIIAYRSQDMVGTPRNISNESVIAMDRATRRTFNNYDYENHHIAIAPGSPCPILFGIRGDSSDELLKAKDMIIGERPSKWLLFMTNQGTDDHIVPKRVRSLKPRDSARVDVRVAKYPVTVPGKHVILRVTDGCEIDAAFYEPSRAFRDVARALIPGDEVTLYGSVRAAPRSLNVEKMLVRRLVEDVRKSHNPMCDACGKRMGSVGANQGFRCKKCGRKAPYWRAIFEKHARNVKPGWYEPPVASRRHLHKPIRRLSRVNIDNL